MVRLGLLDASDDDEEFTTARSPYAAPTEADDSEDEQPHAAADRTPRRSFSPGGLFSRSDGSGRAEASPGARDRLGLAAQLDLDADAVGRWRRALRLLFAVGRHGRRTGEGGGEEAAGERDQMAAGGDASVLNVGLRVLGPREPV